MLDQEVTLRVAGRNFQGWQSVQVQKSLSTLAGVFSLQVSNPWAPDTTHWPIKVGASCEVLLGNELVITGYIEDVQASFSSNHHDISISGRDKTGDLVDCSVINVDQLSDVTLHTLCQEICRPFGIEVQDEQGDQEKIRLFKVQPGETAFEAMNRMAKIMGALMKFEMRAQGTLILINHDSKNIFHGSMLQQTVSRTDTNNILSAEIRVDNSQRFNTYTVKSQRASLVDLDIEDALGIEGRAQDESISRYRPLVLLAEAEATNATATTRAQWEATTRAAKASEITCSVSGWADKSGLLWHPGALVRFKSDFFVIDSNLLISSVSFNLDLSQGSTTTLTLTRPEAFVPEPIKKSSEELWKQLSDI